MTLIVRLHNLSGNVTRDHVESLITRLANVKVRRFFYPQRSLWLDFPLGRVELELENAADGPQLYAKLHDAVIDGLPLYVSFVKYSDTARRYTSDRRRSPSRGRDSSHERRRKRSRSRSRRSRSVSRRRSRGRRDRSSSQRRSRSASRVSSPSWDSLSNP
jgi:hypothetical protein